MISINNLEKANQLHQYYIGLVQGLENMNRFANLISTDEEYYTMMFKGINDHDEDEEKRESSFASPFVFFMNPMRPQSFAQGGIVKKTENKIIGNSIGDYDFNVSASMALKIIAMLCTDMQMQIIEVSEELKELGFDVNQK